ncbi:hypothetical protein QTP86_008932 [Hemibagrus guttatus]|nr:hypothetical protein QTP86_008932 [Hemibagrus guttatus]
MAEVLKQAGTWQVSSEFAYCPNRSTDDAITTTLHLAFIHLDNKDAYVRMLFINFGSAFNTIIPQHLIEKLSLLGLNTSLCTWILDFLTGRPHSNHIKFADDTTVVGLISKNDESAYREESGHSPLFIDGSSVEIVKSTKFLGVHLAENFTWSLITSFINKKAQQRLYFLRRLRKAHLPPPIVFYSGTIESILSSCITAWFGNCTVSDRKTPQWIVRTAEKIIGVSLPSMMGMYTTRCIRKANSIVDDPTHPSHTLFTLRLSGKATPPSLRLKGTEDTPSLGLTGTEATPTSLRLTGIEATPPSLRLTEATPPVTETHMYRGHTSFIETHIVRGHTSFTKMN